MTPRKSENANQFGPYLRQLRESRSMTQVYAAERLGVTKQRLWDIENGIRFQHQVPQEFLEKVSRVFGVPLFTIVQEAKARVKAGRVVSENLAEMREGALRCKRVSAELLHESKRYAPEIEAMARELYDGLTNLHNQLSHTYSEMYPKSPKPASKDI